jgi:hypothetical protein
LRIGTLKENPPAFQLDAEEPGDYFRGMLENTARQNLLAIAAAYGRAEKLSLSQVSKRCYGNAGFLDKFRKGEQTVSLEKMDEMLRWFSVNWPAEVRVPFLPALFMRVRPGKIPVDAHVAG